MSGYAVCQAGSPSHQQTWDDFEEKISSHCLVSVLSSTDYSSKLIVVGHHSFVAYAPTLWN